MARATEFCIGIDNRPGTLAKLCGALKRARVNVDAISVCENSECCWVRLVASPTPKAKRALTKARYRYGQQPVITMKAHNRPGELERVASRLGKKGVNINYIYGSNAPGEKGGMLVLSVDDLPKAVAALR